MNISEKSFEQTIEDTLITGLPAKEGAISETTPNFTNFIPGVCRIPSSHTQFKVTSADIPPTRSPDSEHTKLPRIPLIRSGP
jgi:hypothetical protein